MQLITKCLFSGCVIRILAVYSGIQRENGCPGKAKHIVLLEITDNGFVHITELTAVAFIKNNHDLPIVNSVRPVSLDEGREFLYGCDDNTRLVIGKLLLQNSR